MRRSANSISGVRTTKTSEDEDIVPQEMLDAVERLDREEYDVAEMMAETFLDLDQIVDFLDEARKFEPKHDDKLQKLIRLLKSKELAGQKVLIFTEFADTARYLKRQLDEAGSTASARSTAAPRATGPTSSSASRPTTTASARAQLAEDGPDRDPRPDLDRRALRRPEPSGRVADDQLRHPLEPGAPDAAHRPRGSPHEPGGREARWSPTTRRSRRRAARSASGTSCRPTS